MGYPNAELIAPAILLDHPGVTKEEFVEILDGIEWSDFTDYAKSEPWDSHESRDLRDYGYEKMGRMFNLGRSNKFKRFQRIRKDKLTGLSMLPPLLLPPESGTVNSNRVHRVSITNPIRIYSTYTTDFIGYPPPKIKDVSHLGGAYGSVVRSIIKSEGDYTQAIVSDFECSGYFEEYSSLEEVYKLWPQFSPEFRFDFTQERGNFSVAYNGKQFLWNMREGRYYLDSKTFDLIPPQLIIGQGFGYTDLIMTAEAIRNKAWKLLSRRGQDHLKQFYTDFPEADKRHQKAAIDIFSSQNAQNRQLTHTEYLRMLLPFVH